MSPGPPPVPGGRTPEEREAARLEREARRAGKPKPSAPASPQAAAAPPPATAATDARQAAKPPPGAPPPGERDWLEAAREHAARPPSNGRPPTRERPVPVERSDRLQALRERVPSRRTSKGRVRTGRIVVALVGVVLLLGAAWFVLSLFQPFGGDGEGQPVRVVVPRGVGVGEIGDLLEERGIISSSFFFQTRARLTGRSADLKPGVYSLKRDMSTGAALDALEKGTPPNIVVLTIPEGQSRREVARIVERQARGRLHGGLARVGRARPQRVRRPPGARPRGLPVPGHLRAEEGAAGERPGRAAALVVPPQLRGRRPELRARART